MPTHGGDHNIDNYSECGNDGHSGNNDNGIAITGKRYTPNQFWNYVDDYLNFIHTELFKDYMDPATKRNKITWYDFLSSRSHTSSLHHYD